MAATKKKKTAAALVRALPSANKSLDPTNFRRGDKVKRRESPSLRGRRRHLVGLVVHIRYEQGKKLVRVTWTDKSNPLAAQTRVWMPAEQLVRV